MSKSLLHRTTSRLAKGVDQVFARTALNPPRAMKRSSPSESLGHAERMRGLLAIESFYNRDEFRSLDNALFVAPERIAPEITRVRKLGTAGEVVDLRWESGFEPLWTTDVFSRRADALSQHQRSELGLGQRSVVELLTDLGIDKRGELRDKYLAVTGNRFGHARWLRHAGPPRPCAVLVHGYMAGHYVLEERVWPVRRLFDSGLDVVLPVLPFHGQRRAETRSFMPPAFPSSDPRFTIEGFRQTVFDFRSLFGYLLEHGVSELGVMGMSLGGYTAALLATLDARLRFAVLFVPLAAIDEFAFTHGRMVGTSDEQGAQRDALRRAQWMVSPLARPALVKGEDVIVIAGESDQVTGMVHAERLAEHFGARIEIFSGGHLLHFGKTRAFMPVWEMLGRLGYTNAASKGKR